MTICRHVIVLYFLVEGYLSIQRVNHQGRLKVASPDILYSSVALLMRKSRHSIRR